MKFRTLPLLLCLALAAPLFAGDPPADLAAELERGGVSLARANGNGNSSGDAVEAELVNQGDAALRIDVNIARPLFLVNKGSGQNMVATQVYLRDGAYMKDGRHAFIALKPREKTRVTFVAYCADFRKENPAAGDRFERGALPAALTNVLAKIRTFEAAHPDADITAAAQAAVWLVQGETVAAIREKFDLTPDEEVLARTLAK